LYISLLFAISSIGAVFLVTINVAISGPARVNKIGFALSKGLINFYMSLLLAKAILLIINKKGSAPRYQSGQV